MATLVHLFGRVWLAAMLSFGGVMGARALGTFTESASIAVHATRNRNTDLYLISVSRPGLMLNLTRSEVDDYSPAWSPDGTKLAFVASQRGGTVGLQVMDLYERQRRVQLPLGELSAVQPMWSPDGSKIAFSGSYDATYHIYVYDLATETLQNLTESNPGDSFFPVWSKDGRSIAYATQQQMRGAQDIMVYEGGDSRRLAGVGPCTYLTNLTWLAADTQLTFTCRYTTGIVPAYDTYTTAPTHGQLQRVEQRFEIYQPDWTPDEQWVAFTSSLGTPVRGGAALFVMRANGADMRRLTDYRRAVGAPAWQPSRSNAAAR